MACGSQPIAGRRNQAAGLAHRWCTSPGPASTTAPAPTWSGRLIEVWSGKPLDQYLEERIFKPLHMADTGFWVPEAKWNRLATLYDRGPEGQHRQAPRMMRRTATRRSRSSCPGAGGLASRTTVDYMRFAQMLLNGGELEGVRIVSPKTHRADESADLLGDLPIFGGPDGARLRLRPDGRGQQGSREDRHPSVQPANTTGKARPRRSSSSIRRKKLLTVYMIQKRQGVGHQPRVQADGVRDPCAERHQGQVAQPWRRPTNPP